MAEVSAGIGLYSTILSKRQVSEKPAVSVRFMNIGAYWVCVRYIKILNLSYVGRDWEGSCLLLLLKIWNVTATY